MIATIKGNSIINAVPSELVFDEYTKKITVQGEIPADALVTVHFTGLPWDIWYPFKRVKEQFEISLLIPNNVIEFVNSSQRTKFVLTIKVNDYIVGAIPYSLNMRRLTANGKRIIDNVYKELLQEMNTIKNKLDIYLSKNHTDGLHLEHIQGIKPGMIPIAMDEQGHFKFDYPFSKLEATIVELTSLFKSLTESNEQNTTRIGKLEEGLFNLQNQRVI